MADADEDQSPAEPLDLDALEADLDAFEADLDAVEAALARIESNGYGRCVRCDRMIDAAVLRDAPLTVDCGLHGDGGGQGVPDQTASESPAASSEDGASISGS